MTGRDDARSTRSSSRRCARTVPYTRSVANARSRSSSWVSRNIVGSTTCAYAPSSMRTSASSATRRALLTSPARTVRPDDHGSSRRTPCGHDLRVVRRAARARRRRRSARQILSRFPSTVVHAPGLGLPARITRDNSIAGRDQSSSNSSTVSLSAYVGSPTCSSGAICARSGRVSSSRSVPSSTRRARSSPAVSSSPIVCRRARVDRAGVEALLDLHDAHAGLVVAREHRPLDRRGAAPARQAARSARSRSRAAPR